MPKRRSDERVGLESKSHRCHLYLVIHDEDDRYAIRKFDLSLHSSSDHTALQRLPPPLISLESPMSGLFASIGSNIMVMDTDRPERIVPVFDVCTKYLTLGPRNGSRPFRPIYLPVGDRLAALDEDSSELLRQQEWGWSSWRSLPNPPFNLEDITSHAVHPDSRTIFVSTKTTTFSLDTRLNDTKWMCHGQWKLPFVGRAHFDPRLDAWVGLSGGQDTLGYLCSSDVVSTDPDDPSGNTQSPSWKVSKKRLFGDNQAEKHIGTNLVYLGVRLFCLVHYFSVKDDASGSNCKTRYMLRPTTFSLEYDKNGDLRTGKPSRVQCYSLPTPSNILAFRDPVAFWL